MKTAIAYLAIAVAATGAWLIIFGIIFGNTTITLSKPPECKGAESCPTAYTNLALTPIVLGISLLFGGLTMFVFSISTIPKHGKKSFSKF